ncbi:MAG: response regulator [Polyangiaceae bacterium]|nr:response regulator [Polyangiaceae bacterium]
MESSERRRIVEEIERLEARLRTVDRAAAAPAPPAAPAKEVSMRALPLVRDAVDAHGVSRLALVEGTDLDPAALDDLSHWTDWATYCRILDNAERLLGNDILRRTGERAFETRATRIFSLVAWMIPSELALVRWVAEQMTGPGSLVFRCMTLAGEERAPGELFARIRVSGGRRLPPVLQRQIALAAEQLPTLMGQPPARVSLTEVDGGADVTLLLAPGRKGRFRYALQRLLTRDAAAEVKHAYDVLRERELELEQSVLALERERERKNELEQLLRESQKMEAVGRLAGGVAHGFNNLLMVIVAHAEFLLQRDDLSPPSRADAATLFEAAKRAARLTSQLLAFSRQQVLELEVLSVAGVLDGIHAMLETIAGDAVSLELALDDAGCNVEADRDQLEQILVNLASNARDAMPRGGALRIGSRRVELGPDDVRDNPDASPGPHVSISVSDTGVGIDAATRARLFEPFFTTKERGRGTGLGLATVYGLVRQFGGHVLVETEVGRGTTFHIRLPVVDRPATCAAPCSRAVPRRGNEVVLLVEDDPLVRRAAARILRTGGYRALAASGATEALALLADHAGPIDVLLTDISMSGMSGDELATVVREQRPGIRILYMSGYSSRPLSVVGDAFLQKPFGTTDLLTRLDEILGARGDRGRTGT